MWDKSAGALVRLPSPGAGRPCSLGGPWRAHLLPPLATGRWRPERPARLPTGHPGTEHARVPGAASKFWACCAGHAWPTPSAAADSVCCNMPWEHLAFKPPLQLPIPRRAVPGTAPRAPLPGLSSPPAPLACRANLGCACTPPQRWRRFPATPSDMRSWESLRSFGESALLLHPKSTIELCAKHALLGGGHSA